MIKSRKSSAKILFPSWRHTICDTVSRLALIGCAQTFLPMTFSRILPVTYKGTTGKNTILLVCSNLILPPHPLFLQVYFLPRQLQGRLCLVHLDHSPPTRRSAVALPRSSSSSSTCSNRTHLPQTQPPAARCLNRPPSPQPFLPFFFF